ELLGHVNLSSTQKYTHVSIDRLMEVYDRSHPRS
ncbi:MAG: tyrosine recombinase XerC, partial [Desulfobacteraceae bacterium]